MALYRAPNVCPFCKAVIQWIANPPPPYCIFIGDTGGHYEDHDCPEKKEFMKEHFKPLVSSLGESQEST